jgi:sulfotransferase family protein
MGARAVSANLVVGLSALVEVLDVSLCDLDSELLHGRGVDTPLPGGKSETYALDIEGWALGHRPVEKVRIVHDGRSVWRTPMARGRRPEVAAAFPDVPHADRSGFRTSIGTLRLPPEFELLISAPLGNGEVADLATLRARRARLRLDTEPRIQPLIISTLGRAGSTAVTRMLEALPSVIAYDTYRREASVASYWTGVLTALAEPDSYRRQTMHGTTHGNWWLGGELVPPVSDGEPVQGLMGVAAVESLAAFCAERISVFYERLAGDRGGSGARYFVEKYTPGVLPEVLWDLYPGAREVIMVRDFRDVAASMLAFGTRTGPIRTSFGRHSDKSDADFIRRLGRNVSGLDPYRQRRGESAFVLRYEDLVRRPEQVIPALLRHLDLDTSAEIVTAVHDAFLARSETTDAHRTTAGLEASIGRWERDFDAGLRSVCQEAFGPALEAFGYLREESGAPQ